MTKKSKKVFNVCFIYAAGLIFIAGTNYAEEIDSSQAYIWIEAESAYTNFPFVDSKPFLHNGEAIFVDSPENPAGEYFAQFKFILPCEGEFYFWIGGSPAGSNKGNNRDSIWYSSFSWSFDNRDYRRAAFGNTSVGFTYAQDTYHWTKIGRVQLEKGEHTLFIKVDEFRLRDENFTMYVDTILLLPSDWHYLPDKSILKMSPKETVLYLLQYPNIQDVSLDNFLNKYKALKVKPFDLENIFSFAQELEGMDLLAEAIKQYEQIVKIDSHNKKALIKLVELHRWRDENEKAALYYQRIAALNQADIEAHHSLADYFESVGYQDEAIKQYEKILKITPDDVRMLMKTAQLYHWNDQLKKAVSCYLKVIEIEPDNTQARYTLGELYESVEKWDKAKEQYKAIVELNSDYVDVQEAEIETEEHLVSQSQIGYKYFRDSAHIKKDTEYIETGWNLSNDVRLDLDYSYLRIEDDFAKNYRHSLGAVLRHRLKSNLSVSGGVRLNLYEDGELFCYKTGLEYTPFANFSLGFTHLRADIPETAEAIERGIYFYGYTLDFCFAIMDKITLLGSYGYRDYSDGNSQFGLYNELEYMIFKKPELIIGVGCDYQTFDKGSFPDRLYWSPNDLGLTFLKISWKQEIPWKTYYGHYGVRYTISLDDAELYGHYAVSFLDFPFNETFSLGLDCGYYRSAERFTTGKTYSFWELGSSVTAKF